MNERCGLGNYENSHCLGCGASNQKVYHSPPWLAIGSKREMN